MRELGGTRAAWPLAVMGLVGDEAEMGRQAGELTRELGGWEATIRFYAGMPGRLLGAGRRDRGRALMVKAMQPLLTAGLRELDRVRPAALRARTEAFLVALGRPPDERRNVFVLDVAQNAVGLLARWGLMHDAGRLAMAGACSSFAVWGDASEDGRILHARNFDLPGIGIWERGPTVVFCAPRRAAGGLRYGFVAARGADVPGVTAFNEAGLVVSAHTRFHRRVAFDGLGIVDLGHLIASRATSLADAVAIAAERRVASSWGIVVTSARERRTISIEAHAGRIAVHRPRPGSSHIVVTNRNRVPVMQPGEIAPSPAWVRYSDGREAALERLLDGVRGLTVEGAMGLLSSHECGDVPGWERETGDCPAQSISVQSVVVDPEREEVWVSVGEAPTSKGPWVKVPWQWERTGPELRVIEAPAVAPDPSARARAYRAYVDAARLEAIMAPEAEVEARMREALVHAPDDPSYRHLMGGLALRSGRPDEALGHLEVALANERSEFRIGELHRWAALAARWSGQVDGARRHRASLMASGEPSLVHAKHAADRPMPRRRHREIGVDFQMLTLSI